MKNKLTGILIFATTLVAAQETAPTDTTRGWIKDGNIGLNISQLHLENWAAGGQSSLSLLSKNNFNMNYFTPKSGWDNSLEIAYGILRPAEGTLLKTDDKIELNSKIATEAFKDFRYAFAAGFRTQFAPGYNYPNDTAKISEFMAPGYLTLSIGLDYQKDKWLTLFLSPFTGKFTFVQDEELANAGAFGVDPAIYENGVLIRPGEQFRKELGAYFKAGLKRNIAENMQLKVDLNLFSNYLDRPENIDVSWENSLIMKVNKYINVTISTHLLYDHDIDIAIDENEDGVTDKTGPRTQFKELISFGLQYAFKK